MKIKDYLFWWIMVAVFLAALGVGMYREFVSIPREKASPERAMEFQDSVLNVIFEMRMEHPYIVYAQAIIESGNFTSPIFKENHNMFGMKMPERRATVAIGISRGHAVYKTWQDCLIDYALFQSNYLRGLTEEEYFIKIGSFYAEDGSYEFKIREAKNKHKRSIK